MEAASFVRNVLRVTAGRHGHRRQRERSERRARRALARLLRTVALQAICDPEHALDPERSWKLLLLAPRMLHRQPGEGPKTPPAAARARQRRMLTTQTPLHARRGERAARLAGLGEVSAAARALTAQALAPGTLETPQSWVTPRADRPRLRGPCRLKPKPSSCRARSSSQQVSDNLRSARRGAAPGPSGATAEHYHILLDDEERPSLVVRAQSGQASRGSPSSPPSPCWTTCAASSSSYHKYCEAWP